MIPIEAPAPFAAMAAWPQWIVWEIQLRDGDEIKCPIDPTTGRPSNSQDPATWRSYADAAAAANARPGAGVGFVFTKADPFFFIDVDKALLPNGQWSDIAKWVASQFPGATFEVSHSGTGFHLFGQYTSVPAHSCRRSDWGVEFYTDGRFCANTLKGAAGANADYTPHLTGFAAHYPENAVDAAIEWTEGADPEWRGPVDDTELLRRFFTQRPSVAAAFSGAASNRQLYDCDVEALAKTYPPEKADKEFNWSAADLALCTKLAFWTGKDCARIERIVSASPLGNRDKWKTRAKYRQRTIKVAVAGCNEVYKDPHVANAVDPLNATEAVAVLPVDNQMAPDQQIGFFKGCVYVADRNRVLTPFGEFYKEKVFRSMYGGHIFMMDFEDGKTSNAWEAFVESRTNPAIRVHTSTFRPQDPPGTVYNESGRALVNSWAPVDVPSAPGDVAPFLDFMQRLIPDPFERALTMNYCAALIQNPGVKFQWALVIQGAEGNGKSFLGLAVATAIGEKYSHFPNARDIGNKFNAWFAEKLFICVEEVHQAGDEGVTETLKWMVTNKRVEIQGKGSDQVTADNVANFLFFTNHKDAIRKTRDDRRYAIIFSGQQSKLDIERDGMGGDYFPNLYEWFEKWGSAAVTNYLQTFQIDAALNPAGRCHRAPDTPSMAQAIVETRSDVEARIVEAIGEGEPGFRGGWISSVRLAMLFERERGTHRKRKAAILVLGYVPHPNLPEGRSTARIMVDGDKRPTLYVLPGSLNCNYHGGAVSDAYEKAQSVTPGVPLGGLGVTHGT